MPPAKKYHYRKRVCPSGQRCPTKLQLACCMRKKALAKQHIRIGRKGVSVRQRVPMKGRKRVASSSPRGKGVTLTSRGSVTYFLDNKVSKSEILGAARGHYGPLGISSAMTKKELIKQLGSHVGRVGTGRMVSMIVRKLEKSKMKSKPKPRAKRSVKSRAKKSVRSKRKPASRAKKPRAKKGRKLKTRIVRK